MKTRFPKTDANQSLLVAGLRACGYTVAITAAVGNGFPDLVVGQHGKNYLLEVKPAGPAWAQKLNKRETEWHALWRGQVAIVSTVDEALAACGGIANEQE